MAAHEECLSYTVLRREAAASLDPSDPDYALYTNLKRVSHFEVIYFFSRELASVKRGCALQ
jgi:hypothetical protein